MVIREKLSETLLDINFVKLISPIYSIQMILGSSCIVMSGNFVSPITIYQKIYSVLWIIIVSGSFYHFEVSYYYSYYDKEKTLFYTFAFGLLVQYVSYLLNVFNSRFIKSENTVAVFLKMQKIDRELKHMNLASLYSGSYYINKMWIAFTMSFSGGYSVYVYYNFENVIYTIPMGCAILSVYTELVCTGSCIYYLALRLQFLNGIAQKNIIRRKRITNHIKNIGDLGCATGNVGVNDNIIGLKDFTRIITSILKLFDDTSKLCKFEILNVIVTVFIWTFLVIESTVVGLRSKLIPILTSVIFTLWICFSFVQITLVAISCDWFAKQVRETKRLALHALSICCEDKDADIRKSSWELLQLIEFEKPIFSVYGIFTLDIRLPLQLVSVITTNVLVLIQYTSNALNTN